MEDDYFFTEKHSIRESARSLKKYGSTCNHVRNELMLIRHELEKTDTLQGIALKYGCTVSKKIFNFSIDVKYVVVFGRLEIFSFLLQIYNFLSLFHSLLDWTNTSSKSSVRSRQPVSATVPDDTGRQRFVLLSERWSTTIVAHWFIEQFMHARYANKFTKQSIDEGAQSGRGESQGYWRVYG